ncbi:DUF6252 family protein [Hymenobacter sp.]|uniref:DUF6252 family protein n=1 Tax=Hymenobacter sp. TaxID=1898978 RepID=UPI00286A4394|nr:DUF6252 family protein [Hymenobacter sp.]
MRNNLPLYLALVLLTQCSKCKNDPRPRDPAAALPPATQTGANTFGCLVNGQPYTPKGNNGTSNLYILYDAGFRGGALGIQTYRIDGNRRQYLSIDMAPVTTTGIYSFARPAGICTANYADTPGVANGCNLIYSDQDVAYRSGQLAITKFDTRNRIVSGTFSFKLLQAGCDTLKVTQGRFDAKL